MRIRIATKAWNGSRSAKSLEEADAGIRTMWVELDGHRTQSVVESKVETSDGVTFVTLKFIAAAEMVLLNSEGEILA